jgi:exopolysaccharide production protein ExoQ
MSSERDLASGQTRLTTLTCGYVALLLMLGGGGTPAPASEIACQLLAALSVLLWLWIVPATQRRTVPGLALTVGLIAALPLLQLIPLPPMVWQALPDRGDLREALALIGREQSWHAWSIAPYRTFSALLSLAPPLLALVLASQLDTAGRRNLLKTIAAVGLLSVAVGALQLAANGGGALQFYGADGGALYGFQANRNSQADVLLIALLALVAAWAGGRSGGAGRDSWPGIAALAVLLLLAVVLTTSRTGIVLIPIALLMVWWMVHRWLPSLRLPRWTLAASLTALAAILLWAWRSPAVARVLARFDFAGEYRVDIWRDTWFAIERSWPVGTGLGTFQHAIFPAERLEAVGPTLPNRAHNEALELILEGGLPALACWIVVTAIVLFALRRAVQQPHGSDRLSAQFAAGTLAVTGLHAVVDYPFRSMALAGLIGVAAGFALATGALRHSKPSELGDGPD